MSTYGPPPYSSGLGAGGYGPLASGFSYGGPQYPGYVSTAQPSGYSSGLGAGGHGPYAEGYRGGTTAAPAAASQSSSVPVGGVLQAVSGAVGGYYSALSRRGELKSQALSLDFEAFASQLDARSSELDAMAVLDAGKQAIGQYTMQSGQFRASVVTSQAARGIQAGVGSAAEVLASMDLRKEIDTMTIKSNAARRAAALRIQAQNERSAADMARVSAANTRRTARGVNEYSQLVSGIASLLGTAGSAS